MLVEIEKKKIIISDTVLSNLKKFIQNEYYKHEAGGIILGQIKSNEIYILDITTPNKSDASSKYSFTRGITMAQKKINSLFKLSNSKTIYLGEWHTHPENSPKPSSIDLKMIKKQYSKSKLNEAYILMLIMGIEELYLSIYNGKKNIGQTIKYD
tara:strand:+ start:4100 stop:4561 length:462 start_codon:yes stop_codon:yes gene_type:complete